MASELGVSLRSIWVTESRAELVKVTPYPRYYVFTLTIKYYYQSERYLKPLELAYYTAHLSMASSVAPCFYSSVVTVFQGPNLWRPYRKSQQDTRDAGLA